MIASALVYCIVGCNTGAPGRETLHVLECDVSSGAAKIVQTVAGPQGTTYFRFSPDGRWLYTVVSEKRDGRGLSALVRFPFHGARLGEMERLASLPCEAPCHVELSPDGSAVSFAAYTSGTYGVCATDGSGLRSATLPDDAVGPRKDRQQKAFAHQTFFTRDGAFMGVCDLGCDRVNFYTWKRADGLAAPVASLKADPGDGPRHALFSRDGRFLFVVNELSSTVTSYRVTGNGEAGVPSFERVGKWSMLPEGCTLKNTETKAAAIKLTEDGRILMASNRGHDSIAFFAVGEDGRLARRNVAKLTGKFPRDFELMPGGKFMAVGHKMSDEIRIYAFDRAECTLTPAGDPIPCWRPLCFKFAAVPPPAS